MKNIKNFTIYFFAIIGFVAILSSFNNQTEPQVTYGTPESHEWEIANDGAKDAYMWNKITGEVRALTGANKTNPPTKYGIYKTLTESR